MEILSYKHNSQLVFLKDNETVYYDFKDKSFYKENPKSKTLRKVKTLGNFFRGVTVENIANGMDNPHYAEYIRIVNKAEKRCRNLSTILERLAEYTELEKYVLAGIKFSEVQTFNIPLSRFAKPVREFMATSRADFSSKKTTWKWSNNWTRQVEVLKNNGWELNYMAHEQLFINICTYINHEYHNNLEVYRLWIKFADSYTGALSTFNKLLSEYNCEYKALFSYLINVHRYEALTFEDGARFLKDYLKMCTDLNRTSFDKYPKNLRLAHDLVARNYNNQSRKYDDIIFAQNVDTSLAWSKGDYQVIVPQVSADVKKEGINQDHCVASYISSIIDGTTQIVFMRQSEEAFKNSYTGINATIAQDLGITAQTEIPEIPSLITLEIRNGQIIQARGYKNRLPTPEESEWINSYAKEKQLTVR